jgi:hypothetical protein
VGDIAPDVTDIQLMDEFKRYFPSVKGAKVSAACCMSCAARRSTAGLPASGILAACHQHVVLQQ